MSANIAGIPVAESKNNTESEPREAEANFPEPLPEADEYNRRVLAKWLNYRLFKAYKTDGIKLQWRRSQIESDEAKEAFNQAKPSTNVSLSDYRKEHETTEGLPVTADGLRTLGITDEYDGPLYLPEDFTLPADLQRKLGYRESVENGSGRSDSEEFDLVGHFEGCGKVTADRLIAAGFGTVSKVESANPAELAEIKGVSPAKASKWSTVEAEAVESEPEATESDNDEPTYCGSTSTKSGKPCKWNIANSPCKHHDDGLKLEDVEDEANGGFEFDSLESGVKKAVESAPDTIEKSEPSLDSIDSDKLEKVMKLLDAGFSKDEIVSFLG